MGGAAEKGLRRVPFCGVTANDLVSSAVERRGRRHASEVFCAPRMRQKAEQPARAIKTKWDGRARRGQPSANRVQQGFLPFHSQASRLWTGTEGERTAARQATVTEETCCCD